MSRPNRRRFLRFRDDGVVRVCLRRPGLLGRLKSLSRTALDLNRHGVGVLHDQPLEPGTELMLDLRVEHLALRGVPGVVRACGPHPDGFRIGIEFRPGRLRPAAERRMAHGLHEFEKAVKRH